MPYLRSKHDMVIELEEYRLGGQGGYARAKLNCEDPATTILESCSRLLAAYSSGGKAEREGGDD